MKFDDFQKILQFHNETFTTVSPDVIETLVACFCELPKNCRIFGLGAGRMGYSLQAFIMRLSHLGYDTFMIGDTSLPRIGNQDIAIINSSSGETPTIGLYAQQAKSAGAKLIMLTSSPDSSIARLADLVVSYRTPRQNQIMKTANEQFSLLFLDYVAHLIVIKRQLAIDMIETNHSILE